MVLYNCNLCNFTSKNKADYSRHERSKKHQKKVNETSEDNNDQILKYPKISTNIPKYPQISEKMNKNDSIKRKYICKFCDLECARANSLNKHLKTCSVAMVEKYKAKYKTEFEVKLRERDMMLKSKERELNFKDDQIDELKSDLIYYKNLIKTAGVGVGAKITTNVQSLIVSKHEDAPALEYAKPNLLKFNSKDAHENSLFLVNRYKDNTFTMFVGRCIVAACKKEDPDEQSIWSTDANRLTMFIKKMMDDESKWISDKKGVQTTKYLISPILQKIKEMLIDYNKHLYSQISKLSQHEVDYYNDIMIHCRELVHFIEHEKLADEILRYMAPRLTYEIK